MLRGNDQLNQVAVALVLIPLVTNNRRQGNTGVNWLNILVRLRVQCILLGERIIYGLRESLGGPGPIRNFSDIREKLS